MSQHKRNVGYSNALKDFALSFERSDPISFLLFNVYGTSPDPDSAEYNLRLDVWSSVCAQLFVKSEEDYQPLFNEVFKAFSTLHEWRAKQQLELFLMDLLQRSAFLHKTSEDLNKTPDLEGHFLDPLSTREAEKFLDQAVHDLYEILNDQDGGLPYGALHFGSAVLGKLDVNRQSSFRGCFFFQWFFCEFLRKTMVHPEVSLPELEPRLFSFNSPHGACSSCHGLGTIFEFDPDLIVNDESLSLENGAVEAWRKNGA